MRKEEDIFFFWGGGGGEGDNIILIPFHLRTFCCKCQILNNSSALLGIILLINLFRRSASEEIS